MLRNKLGMHYRQRYDTVEITTPRKKEKLFFQGCRSAAHTQYGIQITPNIGAKYTIDEWGIKHWN